MSNFMSRGELCFYSYVLREFSEKLARELGRELVVWLLKL
jgi:hypothetical protein